MDNVEAVKDAAHNEEDPVDVNDMVPITREELKKCYEQFSIEPVSQELVELRDEVKELVEEALVLAESCDKAAEVGSENRSRLLTIVRECLNVQTPNKIEENMFLSRSQLEEIWTDVEHAQSRQVVLPKCVAQLAHQSFEAWSSYQASSSEKIEHLIHTFVPKDWRRTMVDTVMKRSEQQHAAELHALEERGCTVAEKYELLWTHELAKRQSLASIGSMNSVFKTIVATLGGVPHSLLDFVATINSDTGPMQEMRDTYGPTQYFLTHLIFLLRAMLTMVLVLDQSVPQEVNRDDNDDEQSLVLQRMLALLPVAMEHYAAAVDKYVALLRQVLVHSPFFVSRKHLDRRALNDEDSVVVTVSREHTVEHRLCRGDTLTWEFSTNKDIRFEALFTAEPANVPGSSGAALATTAIHPLRLVNSHQAVVQGQFTADTSGVVRLVFDNSYSWFTNKQLHLTTKVVPATSSNVLPPAPGVVHIVDVGVSS